MINPSPILVLWQHHVKCNDYQEIRSYQAVMSNILHLFACHCSSLSVEKMWGGVAPSPVSSVSWCFFFCVEIPAEDTIEFVAVHCHVEQFVWHIVVVIRNHQVVEGLRHVPQEANNFSVLREERRGAGDPCSGIPCLERRESTCQCGEILALATWLVQSVALADVRYHTCTCGKVVEKDNQPEPKR